jgi:transglutaminase-like putative cysteine protease
MDFMKSVLATIWMALCFITIAPFFTFAAQFHTAPTPDWAKVHNVDVSTSVPVDLISNGVYYRLVDDQIKVEPNGQQHYFSRIAQTVVNAKGLDDSSLIEIHFDPTYETLIVHDISVIRNGNRASRLESADISIFNSEQDHERRIYDGTVTYNAILGDVLVGDTIDYSYTIVGSNPVYNGLFSTSRTLLWGVPVEDQYHRVLWGKSVPLYANQINGSTDVLIEEKDDFTEYNVRIAQASPFRYATQTPEWYLPRHEIFYSEIAQWEEVNDWALSLYSELGSDDSIKAIANRIKSQATTQSSQLALALDYVQHNIRYIGIELGNNSHVPTPANETLQLKYGDCKDKSVLLLAIMEELGITGFPALVHTNIGKSLNSLPPSVSRFDHVIVNAFINQKSYWLDPTMTDQIGPLESLYQPDYGYALVVSEETQTLTDMNTSSISNVDVIEAYTIPANIEEAAELKVTSNYLGRQAQYMLANVEQKGVAGMSKQYLEYYQRSYPDAVSTAPLTFSTNQNTGWATMEESYLLENAFTQTEQGYEMYFYASDIRNQLVKPEVVKRDSPFERPHPRQVSNAVKLQFADDSWAFDDESFTEDNPYFRFTFDAKFEDKLLTLQYQYTSKQDHVPADEINAYLDAIKRARDMSSYSIIWYKNNSTDTSDESTPGSTDVDVIDEYEYIGWYVIASIVFFALMVIDWRFAATNRKDSEDLRFQPTPLTKFIILSTITYGLYASYWVYRNFYLIEKQDRKGTWPIARGIFSPFWLFALYQKLALFAANNRATTSRSEETQTGTLLFNNAIAVILALTYLALSISVSVVEHTAISFVITLLLPLPLVPFVLQVNKWHASASQDFKNGARIGFRHIFISLIFLPLLLLECAKSLHLAPPGDIVEGSDLWSNDIAFMYRENMLSGNERIQYFYSDAIFSNQLDGNGLTETKVFSYWIDDESGLVWEYADYETIKDIQVEYAEDDLDNTLITIVRDDDTDFILYVTPYTGKDKLFVNKLKSNWASKRGNKVK